MAKIAIDTFTPSEGCYEPAPAQAYQKDSCTVTVELHVPSEPGTTYAPLIFQRERDNFILSPNQSAASLGIANNLISGTDKNNFSSAVFFTITINTWFRSNYPQIRSGIRLGDGSSVEPYTGPDLKPLFSRIANFVSAGEIEAPDEKQAKVKAALIHDMLNLPHAPRAWLSTFYQSLLDKERNLKLTPTFARPRVQWTADILESYEEILKPFATDDKDPKRNKWDLAAEKEKDFHNYAVSLVDYLFNGSPHAAQALDKLAASFHGRQDVPAETRDLFAYLHGVVLKLSNKAFFASNEKARGKLNDLKGALAVAIHDHRAELLGLPAEQAFERSLFYQVQDSAQHDALPNYVKNELKASHTYPQWLQEHAEEIAKVILPSFKISANAGDTARVTIDADEIVKGIDQLAKQHGIQTREYHIGTLAILRLLLGRNLDEKNMQGWYRGGMQKIEVEITGKSQLSTLYPIGEDLSRRIGNSVHWTENVLPWVELGVAGAGAGLGAYGGIHRSNGTDRALFMTGLGTFGLGMGGFICNKTVPTRNKYISDPICGTLLGAGLATAGYFIFPLIQKGGASLPPPGRIEKPNVDGRNPVEGYGP